VCGITTWQYAVSAALALATALLSPPSSSALGCVSSAGGMGELLTVVAASTLLDLFLVFALFCVDANFEANTQGRGKHRDHTALEQDVTESADSAQRHCAGASV